MAEAPRTGLAAAWAFLGVFTAFAGRGLGPTLALVAIGAVLEGFGLVLVLPVADILLATEKATLPFATPIREGLASLGFTTPAEQVLALSAPLLVYFAVRALLLYARDRRLADLQSGLVNHLRRRLFENLVRSDWATVARVSRPDLLDGLTMDVARIANGAGILTRAGVGIALILSYLLVAAAASLALAALLLVALAAAAAIAATRIRRSGEQGARATGSSRRLMAETHNFLSGLKLAKIYRAEDAFLERYQSTLDSLRSNSVAFAAGQARFQRSAEAGAAIMLLALLLVGKLVFAVPGASLILLAAMLVRLSPLVVGLVNQAQQFAFVLPAFAGVESLIRKTAPAAENRDEPGGALPAGAIRFDRVSFRPPAPIGETPASILAEVSVEMPAHGFVAVEGPSGAGKSTFVELLAGLLAASSGEVAVDGVAIVGEAARRRLSRAVSFAPQEGFLFDASLRDNLRWPDSDASDAELWQALAAADCAEFVRALPAGLEETLGERGMRLSGGERQRICLARLLLRPANILILDEATSALDLESEGRILEALSAAARERLVVVVTHRDTARRYADVVLRVEAGRVTKLA